MILQIATLGLFDNERVIHASTKRKVDKLFVISTEKNREEVETMASDFKLRRIPFDHVEVDPLNFKLVLVAVLDIVAKHPDYDIEFNVSCGTRIMAGAAHMAATVIGATLIFVVNSDDDKSYEMSIIGYPNDAILTSGRRKVLAALTKINGKCSSITELAEKSGYSRGQCTRHVNALKRAGYVKKKGHRPVTVEITDIGRIVLRVKQLRKKRIWERSTE
ncbi:MAG: CRISPR-associated CARF protein Csa3 [Candidatus Thorarchaeota archaeon]